MVFLVRHQIGPRHVQCTLFSGPRVGALACCGTFVMRVDEFREFVRMTSPTIEFDPPIGGSITAAGTDLTPRGG